ncbi:hypothetical protein D3C84_1182800 [compost metagenome]
MSTAAAAISFIITAADTPMGCRISPVLSLDVGYRGADGQVGLEEENPLIKTFSLSRWLNWKQWRKA